MRAGFLRPGRRLKPITTTDSAHFKIHQPENGRFGILKQATSPSVRRLDFRFCNGPSAVNPFFRRIHYRVRFANCSAPRKSGTAAIRLAKEGTGCRERSVAGLQTLPLATICRKGGAFFVGAPPLQANRVAPGAKALRNLVPCFGFVRHLCPGRV